MTILLIGINYKTTAIATREKVNNDDLIKRIHTAQFSRLFSESIILSTCNRTEIYLVTHDSKVGEDSARELPKNMSPYLYIDQQAVKHLYKVAGGIDSMVIGESEILGQLKRAYAVAMENHTVGPILHQLFREAIHIGKNLHHETNISSGVTSIAHAAILLLEKNLPTFQKSHVAVIGAGVMGQRVIKNLKQANIANISIVNRTDEKAINLANNLGVNAVEYQQLEKLIAQADCVICATASPHSIITSQMIKKIMTQRPTLPLYLIDLAVPRNIDPHVSKNKSIHLYDLDQIQKTVQQNLKLRKKSLNQAEKIIKTEANKFKNWLSIRRAVPLLIALKQKTTSIQNKELSRALHKLEHLQLNTKEKQIITLLAHRLTNKVLAKPILNLKKHMQDKNGKNYSDILTELFELET